MRRFMIIVAALFYAAQLVTAQAPHGSAENLNWKTPDAPRGPYFPDIFLQGTFIEIGISDAGSYGSTSPAPAGFHPRMGGGYLGFVADWEMNGWTNSSAPSIPFYSGDYFLPGNPWEGFLVEYTYNGVEYTRRNCGANGEYGIIPSSLVNTSAGTTQAALWAGTMLAGGQSLLVQQRTYFNINEARFFIEVTLTNTGTETLTNVEYARHVDPDQEQNLTGDFTTSNYVSYPTGAVTGFAEVVANGLVYGIPMALRLYHPTAKAHVNLFGLLLDSPNEVLDTPFTPTQGAPYVDDVGVGVAVRFPTLVPGASETFLVSYVLNQTEIDDPTPPDPDPPVPVSNWALYLGILLMITFVVIRFRRMI
jgi:hypothetical protein